MADVAAVVTAWTAATDAPASAGIGTAATIIAILASSVIVLGGVAALVRAIWKTASALRDNTAAVRTLAGKLDRVEEYIKAADKERESLRSRVSRLEHGLKGRDP